VPIQLPPALSDRLEQLTFKQKIGLALSGMILLAAAAVFFLLSPLWNKSSILQENIEREKIKLLQIQRTQAQMSSFKKELAEMNNQYKRLENMLPEKSEMPLILKALSDMGQEEGLEFLLFKPAKEILKDFVVEIPIDLNLKGSYHQVEIFFDRLRRFHRIINIRQIELGSLDEKTGRINVRCQLTTFRMQPYYSPQPAATVKAEPKKK
jgi:type IV pilus assembly protein PilO